MFTQRKIADHLAFSVFPINNCRIKEKDTDPEMVKVYKIPYSLRMVLAQVHKTPWYKLEKEVIEQSHDEVYLRVRYKEKTT